MFYGLMRKILPHNVGGSCGQPCECRSSYDQGGTGITAGRRRRLVMISDSPECRGEHVIKAHLRVQAMEAGSPSARK